ncbi:Avirulence (Avh) protein [Phytophthora megakarya]|uniref:Avirulence (Avh) protein n=1 Tax=Phytophthora megakarya TaxID=4795 RepID=A0A225W9Z7_9STRA|nr:Avirulence (Avh) protein [Phytophthora megakarya]
MGLHFLVRVAFLVSIALIGANSSFADRKVLHSDFPKRYKFRGTTKVDITDTRFLRGIDPPEKGYGEERTGKLSFYEKLKDAFMYSKITTEKLQKWLKNEKSADTVFMRLHLDQDDIMFYTNPRFAEWVQYADSLSAKIPEMSAISILTNRYGDDLLYSIIQSAKESPYTNKLGLELETKQMQHWLATGKDPDEVFRLFKLNTDVSRIFDRPQFTMWAKYVDDLNSKHPEESLWMYSTLTKYFSDDALLQITKRAKWSKKDKAIAIKVENDWIREGIQNHKTPYQVLLDVELGDNLMEQFLVKTSVLKIWYKYMNVFNKRYPEEKTSMMETFTQRFGDVEKLEKWLKDDKSADTVFKTLHLHAGKRGQSLFDKPHFAAWVEYADKLSAKIPEKSAISILTKRYGEDSLFTMIKTAKMNPSTQTLAIELETKQIQHWLTIRKDPDEVFYLFQLELKWKNILEQPEFAVWAKYVDDMNTKHPEKPTWMYPTLTKSFSDDALFRMTEVAKGSEKTKALAIKVENDWFQAGLEKHKTPVEALENLGLVKAKEKLLVNVASEDAMINSWVRYMDAFNNRYPKEKTTMIETFTKTFGDIEVTRMLRTNKDMIWPPPLATKMENLVKKLESAQLKMWLDSEKTTDDVFKLLKLDADAYTYGFDEQIPVLLPKWVSYIDAFIKKNPDEKAALFSGLESRLRDRPLHEILNIAKKYSSMESIATKIQTDKFTTYMASNDSPKHVFKLLGLDTDPDHIFDSLIFQSWMKYVDEFNKKNPRDQESWFTPLRESFGFKRMFKLAMQNPSTVRIGKMMENEWIKFALNRKLSPEVTFTHLGLVTAGDKAFITPAFKTWTHYLEKFNTIYPKEKVTMIEVLRASISDRKLLAVFQTAKKDPTTKNLVSNLQDDLINKWIAGKEKPADLKMNLGGLEIGEEMIERYMKKIASTTTS